jgi:hypothetical protein
MPRPDTANDLISDHSDRIGRLESGFTEVSAQLAAQTVQIDNLGKEVASGVQSLSTKIDVVFAPLKVVQDNIQEHKDLLRELEADRVVRKERGKMVRNAIIAIALACGGALAKESGGWLWEHLLVRLFY